MQSRTDRILSWTVTIAAVLMAAAVVHREFFADSPAAAGRARTISFDKSWRNALPSAVQVGRADAPITLVEFVDFQCPVCRVEHQTVLHNAQAKYGDRLAIAYVHYPLPQHRFARASAQAAECAYQQGRFPQFVDAVFELQDSLGRKPWGSFGRVAGIADSARFADCTAAKVPSPRIDSGFALGQRMKISGTPTLIVNGWRFSAPPTDSELSGVVDALLAGHKPKL